ncbi:caspase family protein [Terrabacter sp. Soil810]|uniref:caspase family protein n=1 Tax=Terrabacter sp. Soil810 TaxID=1736418 RepID=UPI00070D2578|nr:caspase family protein [Terrabacter sp. Soil810]KRF39428.1 peptidase C14 caspase catalytic subunit p20 [Terrabacter sp. Soil810]
MAGRLVALLVGIDAYPTPIPPLSGCVNDVTEFAEVLRGRVGEDALDLVVLTDAQATRTAVTSHLTEHLGRAGAQDVALFYYSGHGSQQSTPEELWSVEPDHRNETLVCVDSRSPGSWDLADKELAGLLDTISASGCHTLVVLDCCHSGDGTRDADEVVRLAPPDLRPRPASTFVGLEGTTTGTTRSARWTPAGRHVLLAACRSSEKAKEVTVLGRQRGALSAALEAALAGSDGRPTYRDVLRMVTADVTSRVADQHPQVETADATELDRPFLGGAIPATPRPLTLSRLPDGWSIDSGAVHGVPEPIGDDTTELAVYPLTGETSGSPLATALVTKVLPDRSLVRLTPPLDEAYVYRAVVTSIPLKPLLVGVVGDATGTAALRTAADNADETLVDLVEGDEPADADLLVEATPDGFVITRPGVTRPLVPVVAGEGREERTILALERVARWLRLSALTNPATRLPDGAVRVEVDAGAGPVGAGGTLPIAYAGTDPPRFTVRLENASSTPLWAALLDLTETYGIFTDAFPAGSVALGPGEATSVDLVGQVDDALWEAGTVSLRDQLMVVTSTLEFDPRSLEQEELDVSAAPSVGTTRSADPPALRSNLERVLGGTRTRRLGPSVAAAAVADWRTDSVFVVTSRPRA